MGEGPRLQNFLEADLEKLPHTGRTCPLRRTLLCAIFMAPAHCPNVDKAARSPSLTLAPFWAGVSALPSGPKNVPGSPFSPWNGAAGQKASSGKDRPHIPLETPLGTNSTPKDREPRAGPPLVQGNNQRESTRHSPPSPGHLPASRHPVTPDSPLGLLTLGPGMPCWPLAPRSPFGPAGPCGEIQRAARNTPALGQ